MITFTKSKHNYVVSCTLAWEAGITVYVPCDYMAFTTDILLLLVTYHVIKCPTFIIRVKCALYHMSSITQNNIVTYVLSFLEINFWFSLVQRYFLFISYASSSHSRILVHHVMVKTLTQIIFNLSNLENLSDKVAMHTEFIKDYPSCLLQMSKRHKPCIFMYFYWGTET